MDEIDNNAEQRAHDAHSFELSEELTGKFEGEEWNAILGGLLPFRRRFVEEYLICFNLTESYKRSLKNHDPGQDRYVHNHAKCVWKRSDVKTAIRNGIAYMSARYERVQDRIIEELSYLGFSNMGDYIEIQEGGYVELDLNKATYEQLSAIQEITVEKVIKGSGDNERIIHRTKFRLYDKFRALDMLSKRFGIEAPKKQEDNNVEITGGLPE